MLRRTRSAPISPPMRTLGASSEGAPDLCCLGKGPASTTMHELGPAFTAISVACQHPWKRRGLTRQKHLLYRRNPPALVGYRRHDVSEGWMICVLGITLLVASPRALANDPPTGLVSATTGDEAIPAPEHYYAAEEDSEAVGVGAGQVTQPTTRITIDPEFLHGVGPSETALNLIQGVHISVPSLGMDAAFAEVTDHVEYAGARTWVGRRRGIPTDQLILVVFDEAVAGYLNVQGIEYEITGATTGHLDLTVVNPTCGASIPRSAETVVVGGGASEMASNPGGKRPPAVLCRVSRQLLTSWRFMAARRSTLPVVRAQ